MASLETTRGRQVPAWQQANSYYQQPTDYIAEMQSRSQSATAPATRRRRHTNGDYTIQKGDTLSAIAKRYGTTVQAIAEANGIEDVNKIYVGDSLRIPGSNNAQSTSSSTQKQTATKQQNTRNTTVAPNTRNTSNNSDFTKEQQAAVNRYVHSLQQNTRNSNNASSNVSYNINNPEALDEEVWRSGVRRRMSLAQAARNVPRRLSTTNVPRINRDVKQNNTQRRQTKNVRNRNQFPYNQYPIFGIYK